MLQPGGVGGHCRRLWAVEDSPRAAPPWGQCQFTSPASAGISFLHVNCRARTAAPCRVCHTIPFVLLVGFVAFACGHVGPGPAAGPPASVRALGPLTSPFVTVCELSLASEGSPWCFLCVLLPAGHKARSLRRFSSVCGFILEDVTLFLVQSLKALRGF